MAGFDFRTKPETADTMSFYIFDNLKMQEMGEGGNVYRFDTMQEAVTAWRMVAAEHPDWATALGGSVGGEREIDFVQRREGGVNVLITDFKGIPFWAERPDVARAIEQFAEGPGIDWQVDRELLGTPVLIPYAPENGPGDLYLADKALMPTDMQTPIKSVVEAYVEGAGWVGRDQLAQMAGERGRTADDYPRMSRMSVAYETLGLEGRAERGHTGTVDIAPAEFRGMEDRFHELMDVRERERAERLAAEERVNPPVSDSVLPDTGQPFFDYVTNYQETEKVNVCLGAYEDDNLYVGMTYYDRDSGSMDYLNNVTVNITKLQPFMACIDVNNNGREIMDFLVKNDFGKPAGRSLPSGFCLYPVFGFSPEKLREADPRGFEQYCKMVGIDIPVTKGQVVCHAKTAEDSLDDLKKQAKERAHERNAERPDMQKSRTRDMEL